MTDRPTRWGVVVPPANPTAEHEVASYLADVGAVYVARFDHQPGDLADRLVAYRTTSYAAVGRLSGLGLDAIGIACTGASYPLGRDGDARWAADLSDVTNTRVVTAAGALLSVADETRSRRVTLVSPYPNWLTESARSFWEGCGYTVPTTVPVENDSIYTTTADASRAAIERALAEIADHDHGDDIVVVAGTGAATADAIDGLAPGSPCPIVSSNLALARALAGTVGSDRSTSTAMAELDRWVDRRAMSPAHSDRPAAERSIEGPTR
ncbi:maleate isomerase [Ilumatobacter fluminis]|uniref:Maleate isomerase n=1 Tax=Ilumatobacter fluminis TaxID=467091 RepID=A0A4R7I3V2_9ACTN|nr:maleate isomerase [Ilumatobacter fluminis]